MLKQEPYSHEKYKKKVNKRTNKFVTKIPEHHSKVKDLLFLKERGLACSPLDLSLLYPIVSHLYAGFGTIAWQPELMFRSLIAMMLCGITSDCVIATIVVKVQKTGVIVNAVITTTKPDGDMILIVTAGSTDIVFMSSHRIH